MQKQNRMRGTATRRLITGETWKYRYAIATTGELPDATKLAWEINSDRDYRERYPYFRNQTEFYSATDYDKPLPDSGHFGYTIAYLQVYGNNLDLQRGKWDGGENILCAECAEKEVTRGYPGHSAISPGSYTALYPLLQMNAEIYNGPGVFRCNECWTIILDAETLQLETFDGEYLDRTLYNASDYDKVMSDAREMVNHFANNPEVTDWYVRVLDAEQNMYRYQSGGYWPIETAFYQDSARHAIEIRLARGETFLPEMPDYQPWTYEHWNWTPDNQPLIYGSPESLGTETDFHGIQFA